MVCIVCYTSPRKSSDLKCNQTYDTCIQASSEICFDRKRSQDLGGYRTHNLRNSSVMLSQLSYQALVSKVVGARKTGQCAFIYTLIHTVINLTTLPVVEPTSM